MIELRGVVAMAGMRPVSVVVRAGEVVRVDGPPAAVAALLEVIAGRRVPIAGAVVRPAGAAVLVRRDEPLVAGVAADEAIALWAALAGEQRPGGGERDAVARGRALRTPVWLVDGPLAPAAEAVIAQAAADVRAGAGVMMWTAADGREQVDRVIAVEVADGGAGEKRVRPARPATRAVPWRALARYAAAAMAAPAAVAIAALAAAWLAAAIATARAHEGFWFADGAAAALGLIARLGAAGAAIAAAVAAAARAAAAPAWPAMLRETGAGAAARALALVAGDVGGAAATAAVAALPAVWAMHAAGTAAAVMAAISATLMAAGVAGAVTRLARGGSAIGALVGATVGLMLLC